MIIYVNIDACFNLFDAKLSNNPKVSYLEFMKDRIFPEMNNVELARAISEDFVSNDDRPCHIGDVLDNQMEQDNEDQRMEGIQID